MKITLMDIGRLPEHDVYPGLSLTRISSYFSHLVYPALSLAYLSSYAKKYIPDLDINLIDRIKDKKELLEKIKDTDIVAMTCTTLEFGKAIMFARFIKENKNVPVLIGGVHISFEKKLLECFDIGIIREGEVTFKELIEFYKKHGTFNKKEIKKIKGIMYNYEGKTIFTEPREFIENLDEIPFPDRDLFDMDYYLKKAFHYPTGRGRGTSMITSRGCPYNCKFCGSPRLWKRRIRYHSPKYVVREIKLLIDKYNVEIINIWDGLFTGSKERLKKIVRLMEKEGINKKVKFTCQMSAKILDDETCKLLKRMNMVSLGFGFESGSEKMLGYLKSNLVTVKDNIRAVKLSNKYGFISATGFLIGNPNETEEDLQATYDFIKKYPMNVLRIYTTAPFFGTELGDYAIKKGLISENYEDIVQHYKGDNVLLTDMDRKKFEKWMLKLTIRTNISMYKIKKLSLIRNIGYNIVVNPNLSKNRRMILPYIKTWIKE